MKIRHRPFIRSLIALSVLGTGAAAEPFVYVTQAASTKPATPGATWTAVDDGLPDGSP